MKKRGGFVSNSSSSSFIVQWQCSLKDEDLEVEIPELEGKNDLEKAVSILLDFCDQGIIDDIISKTTEMSSGNNRYISTFHTIMHNSAQDFGESAMVFNMVFTEEKILRGVSRFEKLHETIEDGEGGW